MAAVASQQQPKAPSGTPQKAKKTVQEPVKEQAKEQAKEPVQEPVEDTTSQASSEVESDTEDAESTAQDTTKDATGQADAESTAQDAEKEATGQADAEPTAQDTEKEATGQAEEQNQESTEAEEPKEEQSAEDAEEEQQKKQDAELANKISDLISNCLDRVKPQLKMITEALDKGDRERQNDELDEQKLVDHVKPLIQQAADTLGECHGGIKALDPDGKLGKRAQSKTAERNATPEEYRLGDLLKELSENVENTIEESKRRIQDMPKAKKDLGPMLDILRDPLVQILGGVGMLLNGVLNLLGGLLGRLGLGGLIDSVKKILPIDKILGSMGMKI